MILLPAIDIINGKAVRLARGDFAQQTHYDDDPLEAARRWVQAGARALHVVDLDGARTGRPTNTAHIRRIVEAVDVPVQVGGGLRSLQALHAVAQTGATGLVLGTAAFTDERLLSAALDRFPDRIIVSVDAREGHVATAGWTQNSELTVADALGSLQASGVRRFVYSSIERDGMLAGPDLDGLIKAVGCVTGSITYSGGVGSLYDLESLAALRHPQMTAVIVGMAIYERRFDVGAAQALLDRYQPWKLR
ncbi:MAG: 1-(5-phosphoribosyl)-5-[(5-phosphoribosylamino)methylideneamino]imidazole-4-carboxamide isomerase [Solirubrobacteraceae bacterium]